MDPYSIVIRMNSYVLKGQYLGKYASPTNGHSSGPHAHIQKINWRTGLNENPGVSSPLKGYYRITTQYGVNYAY